jgi:hypothetical protein
MVPKAVPIALGEQHASGGGTLRNNGTNKQIITEKPVSLALEEILSGDLVIVEPEEIRNI